MSKTTPRVIKKNNHSQAVEPIGGRGSGRANASCRILVVNQNSDFRLLCADALASPACRVDVAEDGAAAWQALQARRYSLLITENKLPNLAGDALIRKLRSARMDVPVVVVAGSLPVREPAPDSTCQCAAMLLKPFALDTLVKTVKTILPAVVPGHAAKQTRRLFLPSHDNTTRPSAIALSVRGQCLYCEDGVRFAQLERGHVLQQGAIVRTGEDARTDLLLKSMGTSVRLQARTEIKLEKMALTIKDGLPAVHTLLALRAGRLFTLVHATVAGSTLEIRNQTPSNR
jgi:CheY-like chemotaxis protein